MTIYKLKMILRGIASGSVIIGALLLPWAGQAITSLSRETGIKRPADLQPDAPEILPTSAASSLASRTFFPIVENLSFHSVVLISDKPAFDKCNPPSIEQMQVWWDKSPYWSINIYMGGVSLACDPDRLTPAWMYAVAQQGWTFIPTWVGLQAPCSKYKHPMNADPSKSYLQGKAEASEAVAAAKSLGLMGDQVIYADIESYSGASSACRAAVASFLQGWVDGLHSLKAKAGAYGAPCSSFINDWAGLNPPPDYVWLAHWYTDRYDPFASVWDAPCLSNSLWANRQRIKQYTGPHIETWGGLSATLDSNILDGAINAHAGTLATGLQSAGLRAARLLSSSQGWALVGDHLLWTDDSGGHWKEIMPQGDSPASVLSVAFLDSQHGWLIQRGDTDENGDHLIILSTADGGRSWESFPLPVPVEPGTAPLAQASLDFVDASTGWLALRLQSGGSFSQGRLFATQDGGRTWQERSLPLGEPVRFIDARHGWTAGGPSGDQLFYTSDGGRTWQAQTPPLPDSALEGAYYSLPSFRPDRQVILPVTLAGPDPQLALYTTGSLDDEWTLAQVLDLPDNPEPGSPLPFSLSPDGSWWAASPGAQRLYRVPNANTDMASQLESGLPQGVIGLDFVSQGTGWAIVQDGDCTGQKSAAGQEAAAGEEAFRCTSQMRLMKTADGGRNWEEITPVP